MHRATTTRARRTRRATALETCLASLESGAHGIAFASGMAATTTVLHLLEAGAPRGRRATTSTAARSGCSPRSACAIGLRLLLRRPDRPAHAGLERLDGARDAVARDADQPAAERSSTSRRRPRSPMRAARSSSSTTRSPRPYLQRPLELGADIVVHSTTKYLGGHSDVVGGVRRARRRRRSRERLGSCRTRVGAMPGPFDCWLALRGLKTLAVRMRAHCANARARRRVPRRARRGVDRVHYPGLPDHPGTHIAARQMRRLRRHGLVRCPGRQADGGSLRSARGCSRWPRAWAASRA